MAKRLASFATALGKHQESIASLRAAEPAASQGRTDEDLLSFLLACNMDGAKAAAKLRGAASALAGFGEVTIADVAPWYRTPSPDRKVPDGCIVLLEDMKGGVARDQLGRPVMASIGMQHGTAEEMRKQYLYVSKRVEQYALPGLPPGAGCVVIDVAPQEKGAPVSFRFPDKDVRIVFDTQERCFPGALFSSSHFCGLPMFVTWAFRLVRPFMRAETYEAMVLKPSFAHLPKHVDPSSMLPRWGGTLQWDLDEYVEWRAREEGVDLATLCPRGAGKAFDAQAAANAQAAALAAASGSSEDAAGAAGGGAGVSAPDFLAEGGAIKHGAVSKRGSGRGLFSTVRWKPKLLVLTPEALAYFDKVDPEDKGNALARLVPLRGPAGTAGDASVARVGGTSAGNAHQFCVSAGGRDYLFSADSADVADGWVRAIDEVIRNEVAVLEVSAEAVQVKQCAPTEEMEAMKLTPSQVEVIQ
jgi:hypothetical protein